MTIIMNNRTINKIITVISAIVTGITIVGAILATMVSEGSAMAQILGFVALVFATINVVGGYMVTDRMLGMFQGKGKKDGEGQ